MDNKENLTVFKIKFEFKSPAYKKYKFYMSEETYNNIVKFTNVLNSFGR